MEFLSKRKVANRDLRGRLERACANNGLSLEMAKLPVKGSRKVTYVLNWGRIDSKACFQNEKGILKVIPNGYTVVFEACSYVWIAEVGYLRNSNLQTALQKPMYCVSPVDADGRRETEGSGWTDNISGAFRRALLMFYGEARENQRPNGRLYLGIFYSEVQDIFKSKIRKMPSAVDPSMQHLVEEWLKGQNPLNKPTFGSPGMRSLAFSSSRKQKDAPWQARSKLKGKNKVSIKEEPKSDFDFDSSPIPPLLHDQYDEASFAYDSGPLADFGRKIFVDFEDHPEAFLEVPSGLNEPNFKVSGALLDGDAIAMALTPPPHGAKQTASTQHHASTFDSMDVAQYIESGIHLGHLEQSSHSHQFHANHFSATSGSVHDPLSQRRNDSKRKRALADGGHKLLQLAAGSKLESGNIEDILQDVLSKIKNSHIDEGIPEGMAASLAGVGPENTVRILDMLSEIRRELLVRGIDDSRGDGGHALPPKSMKRRKTSLMEDGSDSTDQNMSAPVEANGSAKRTNDHMDVDSSSSTSSSVASSKARREAGLGFRGEGRMALNTSHRSASSRSGLKHHHAPSRLIRDVSGIDLIHGDDDNLSGIFSEGGSVSNLFMDLKDFDAEASKKLLPNILGCHLSHEGLFFTLAPPNTDGFSEEELANAMTSLRIPAASKIVRATLAAADVDQNGRVSLQEFLQFLRKREQELKEMFDVIDTDKDGTITLRDLQIARDTGKLLQTASDEELQALLEWMDTLENAYQDNKIHFEEFRTGLILLPPATTLNDLIEHFREQGAPEAKYTRPPT